jgi:PAS domain S-box-containing protein
MPKSNSRNPPPAPVPASEPTHAALMHELHVHQAELESQNEELRRTQIDLSAARDRYFDLYDFAPVGYFTLDREGTVVEANLTGAALLGSDRRALLGRRFVRFVAPTHGDRWHRHLQNALRLDDAQRIELLLQHSNGSSFHGQLDCLRVAPEGAAPTLRVTLTNITERKMAEANRRIAESAVEGREAERRRVARELHEELGQMLSALKMELSSLLPDAAPPARARRIGTMVETLDEAVATVRRIATELRPLMLDDLGLNAAIDWLARDTARRLGLEVTLKMDENEPPLPEQASVATYRIVQDALEHVAAHTRATGIGIEVQRRPSELVLTVEGRESAPRASPAPLAKPDPVVAMRDRARMLGGQLEVDNSDGEARVFARFPLAQSGDGHGRRGAPRPR